MNTAIYITVLCYVHYWFTSAHTSISVNLWGGKVLHPKYCKNYAYALAHKMSFACSQPKKVEFKAKIDTFLKFMLIDFADSLVSTETKTYTIHVSFHRTWDI